MLMTNPSLNTMVIAEMIDIVERLRVRPLIANDDPDIAEWRKSMEEAADEIEQLRDENTFLKKGDVGVCEAIDDASEEEMTLEEITAEIQQLLNASGVVG
jgi:adenylyl- and sulfurtransferase ThiI